MLKKSSLLIQVLIAIALALLIGGLSSPDSELFGIPYIKFFGFLGQLFLNALTLLVVPLVGSSIVSGISQMGKDKSFGRLGAKTFFFYILTTFLAVITGLLFVNLIKPGSFMAGATETLAAPALAVTPPTHMEAIGQVVMKLIPVNIFEAASQGNMLGIIFFALLFGFALAKIESTASDTVMNMVKGIFHTLMKMTHFLMRIMPFGVFFLVAKAISIRGLESLGGLGYFLLTVLLGLATFMFVILPLLMFFMGLNPLRHIRAMAPALVTAFSTSSSAATLPITMDCVEKRAGVSNRICSFVVPLEPQSILLDLRFMSALRFFSLLRSLDLK